MPKWAHMGFNKDFTTFADGLFQELQYLIQHGLAHGHRSTAPTTHAHCPHTTTTTWPLNPSAMGPEPLRDNDDTGTQPTSSSSRKVSTEQQQVTRAQQQGQR